MPGNSIGVQWWIVSALPHSHKAPGMWDTATLTQFGPQCQSAVLFPFIWQVWGRTSSLLPSKAVLVLSCQTPGRAFPRARGFKSAQGFSKVRPVMQEGGPPQSCWIHPKFGKPALTLNRAKLCKGHLRSHFWREESFIVLATGDGTDTNI